MNHTKTIYHQGKLTWHFWGAIPLEKPVLEGAFIEHPFTHRRHVLVTHTETHLSPDEMGERDSVSGAFELETYIRLPGTYRVIWAGAICEYTHTPAPEPPYVPGRLFARKSHDDPRAPGDYESGDADNITPDAAGEMWTADEPTVPARCLTEARELYVVWHAMSVLQWHRGIGDAVTARCTALFANMWSWHKAHCGLYKMA